jgi:rRNA maturation RNase YbeY
MALPLDRAALLRLAGFLAARAARNRPLGRITLVLADHDAMLRANRDHLGRTGVTDVISFPHLPLPGETPAALRGDVIVNAQLAVEEGPARGGAVRELALYIAHGLDHLAGASDASPAGRRRMRRRELAWLDDARRANLLNPPRRRPGARSCPR